MLDLFHRWGLPIDASTHGHRIDSLNVWLHWMMLILFIGWGLFFLYILFRFRQKRNPTADYKGVQSHASSYLEAAVAVVEILLLVFISMPMWATRVQGFPDEDSALELRVVAEQFAWNFHYPGDDGVLGSTRPELIVDGENPLGLDYQDEHAGDDVVSAKLVLPVDRDVIVRLVSKDVIHCFSVASLRVKQDVIPGSIIPQWFRATKVHDRFVGCAQLCGLGHFKMKAGLSVVSQEEFNSWYQRRSAEAKESSASAEEEDEW
jgi:cytochrome c oxidase subunit 2